MEVELNCGSLQEAGGKPRVERILGSNQKVTTKGGGKIQENVWICNSFIRFLTYFHFLDTYGHLFTTTSFWQNVSKN